ncbi:cellulose synthase [Enterobacterales bacterium CwR94]|nr:cellulose synthase [Enterobacterales bacterium CwR94]
MTTDFDQLTRDYYRQQQYQAGWFDLLSVMIDGMFSNAGDAESHAFLQQMGEQLAQRYPIATASTVAELELACNQHLARFQWGQVDIQPYENALVLTHYALPPGDGVMSSARWQNALSAVLQGVYAGWIRSQGGAADVALYAEATGREDMLRFRYQRS